MVQGIKVNLRGALMAATIAAAGTVVAAPALAAPAAAGQAAPAQTRRTAPPEVLLPPAAAPAPAASPAAAAPAVAVPEVQPLPVAEPVMAWPLGDARALLAVIETIDGDGLFAKDYRPDALRAAILNGEGAALDEAASKSFAWLAEDMRDGRTPMTARVQWFAVDPDQDVNPTSALMARALETHDIAGVIRDLAPTHPDYQALKAALATTPRSDAATRSRIRINMDRWRWLAQELGQIYLLTNVPEFQLRLSVNNRPIRTYKTVVGKPGRTATPQLAEKVTAVVFNPTWTVPQSIVVGEGLGAQLMRAPRKGYKVTRNTDGTLTVVQQPGDSNSLGRMKIDMPNPHAIYLHDTPSKQYFAHPVRAYSHGCIRTERAVELGMTMAILGADLPPEQAQANYNSGKYTKVPMTKTFPVYITYFTMAQDIGGNLSTFADIYGRDRPVLASFAKPREAKTTQRISDEPVVQLDNRL